MIMSVVRQPGALPVPFELAGISHLRERGLLRAQEVTDPTLRLVERWGRHHTLAIQRGDGTGYLLKRAGEGDPAEVAHEAAVYAWARRSRRPALASLLPRGHGIRDGWLVVDWVPGAATLAEHLEKSGRIGARVGKRLGEALASVHTAPLGSFPRGPRASRTPPWILSLHRAKLSGLPRVGAGSLELLRLCQGDPGLTAALERLRESWSGRSLVHRDVRGENCLVSRRPDGPAIHLVDWEWAGPGDAAWDVGAIFATCLRAWLLSVPFVPGRSPAEALEQARAPLARMVPGLRRFWRAYVGGIAEEHPERDLLPRAASLAGAHLLQSCWEWGQHEPDLGIFRYVLQLAANILADPQRALHGLLGLP